MFATANQQCKPPKEVCRMPWFLVQVERMQNTDDGQQKFQKYFIIHSVDINDFDSSYMYVDGFVKFNHNKQILEGKILLAAEERALVEYEMQQLTSAAENQQQNGKFLLLQYSSAFNNVVYTVLPEKEIVWPTVLPPDIREVIVNDEQQQEQRVATILLMDSEQKLLETEFEALKEYTLKQTLDTKTPARVGQWILVQYSCSAYNIVYMVLNQRDNIWYEQNLYKDVVAYFKQGQNVHQAIILQRSADIKELLKKMSVMKESCLQFFMTKENKENVTTDVVAVAPSTTTGNHDNRPTFVGQRITFYGSHLNTNGLG